MIAKVERIVDITHRLDALENPDRYALYTTGWWCKSCPFRQPCMQITATQYQGKPQGRQRNAGRAVRRGRPDEALSGKG